jgi:hypothetical protein
MSAAEDAMNQATIQYFNQLVAAVQLDPDTFQLAQGSIYLGTDSSSIWRFFDSLPPDSATNFFQQSASNSFANTYAAVINNLIPQSDNEQQKLLADKFVDWVKYQKDNKIKPADWTDPKAISKARLAQFNEWAFTSASLTDSVVSAMQALMMQTDIIRTALNQLTAAQPKLAYTASINDATNALTAGKPVNFQLIKKTTSEKINGKWAKGSTSGQYWFVSASANSEWDHTISDIAKSDLNTTVKIKKITTLVGGPYSLLTPQNPDLTDYTPWFNSVALNTARTQNDNKLWKHSAPTWESIFGPDGSLQRVATAIVLADGIEIVTTSKASIAKSDQEKFKAAAKFGVFPWFQAEGSGGWSNDVKFNDDGTFTITSGNPKEGNPFILGVIVKNIADAFN